MHSFGRLVLLALLGSGFMARASSLEVTAIAAYEGSHGLAVSVSGCSIDSDLVIEPPPTNISGSYTACRSILANQVRVIGPTVFSTPGHIELADTFSVETGATLSVTNASGGPPPSYVLTNTPQAEQSYNAQFDIDLNNLVLGTGDRLDILTGYDTSNQLQFRLSLDSSGMVISARSSNGGLTSSSPIPVAASGWFRVILAFGAGSGTGLATLSIDGRAPVGLTALNNPAANINRVRFGAPGGVSGEASYAPYYLDEFDSWR